LYHNKICVTLVLKKLHLVEKTVKKVQLTDEVNILAEIVVVEEEKILVVIVVVEEA